MTAQPQIRVFNQPPDLWNEWVKEGLGGPYQTTHYAAYWEAMWGYRARFLVAGDPARPDGILLAYQYSPAARLLFGRPGRRLVTRATWPFWRCSASRFGPVILNPARRTEATLGLLKKAGSLSGLLGGRHHHSVGQVYADQPPDKALVEGLACLGGRLIESLTPVLTIDPDLDKVWAGLNRQARKAARLAQKQGLVVESWDGGDAQAAGRFIDLNDQAKGGRSLGPALPRLTARHLARDGFAVRYFVCRQDDRPVAGLGVHAFGGVASEIAAWMTDQARQKKLAGGDAVKWAVIEWLAASGVGLYDLMGVAPQPANPKEEGIARFKKKWSSELRPVYSIRTRAAVVPP